MRTILLMPFLLMSAQLNAQEELLERLSAEELTPEMKAMLAAFLKHRFEVKGTVKGTDDFEVHPYPLQNANIEIKCVADTTQFGGAAADKDGKFTAYIFCRNKLKDLRVHVKISYIGMQPLERTYTPTPGKDKIGEKLVINLDTVILKSNPITLAEATVIGELQKMYQKGDTTIFNAGAYEMPTGSVLLDLVRRLPGLKYESGKLTYLGENIEEIRLNGDSFFKHDINVALQNMPHDKLKSLKVYEVKNDTLDVNSDNHLVMDMQTKMAVKNADFANANIGITETLKNFMLSASGYTYMKDGAQVGLNFNTRDLPNEGTPSRRNVSTNVALSYERKFKNTTVDASLNHGYTRNDNETEGFTQLYMPGYSQRTITNNFNSNNNHSYSGNIQLSGLIKERTRWNMNLNLSSTDSKSFSHYANSISNDSGDTISNTRQITQGKSNEKRISWNGTLTHKLGDEQKDEIGINSSLNYSKQKSTNTNLTNSVFVQKGDSTSQTNHLIQSPNNDFSAGASAFYNHNFGNKNNIQLAYDIDYKNNSNDETYNDIASDNSLSVIDSLSYKKGYHTLSHGLKASLLIDNSILNMKLAMDVKPTHMLINDRQYNRQKTQNTYNSTIYAPSVQFQFKFNENESSLTLKYHGNNEMPSITNLTATTNYSDPMNIYTGNSNLKEEFHHNAGLEFKYKALLRATVDYASTENQVTMLTTLDRTTGARHTMPENINGNRSIRSYLFLTKQINQISLNAIATHTFSNNASFVQSTADQSATKSVTKYNNYNFVVIGILTNANWITAIMTNYNIDNRKNEYMSKSTGGQSINTILELRYTTTSGSLALGTTLTFRKTFGYELTSANVTHYIWNTTAEYKFLKGKRATIGLTLNDILNSNDGFNASMSDTQWSETHTLGKTSYILLTFGYRLSLFN